MLNQSTGDRWWEKQGGRGGGVRAKRHDKGEGATLSPTMKETAVRKSFQKLKQTRWNKTVSLVLADYAISQVCVPRMHMLGYRDPE